MFSTIAVPLAVAIAAAMALSAHNTDDARHTASVGQSNQTTGSLTTSNVQSNYCRTVYTCVYRDRLNESSTTTLLPPHRRSGCDQIACSCGDYCHLFDACCQDHDRQRMVPSSSWLPPSLLQASGDERQTSGTHRTPERRFECRAIRLQNDVYRCGNLDVGVYVVSACPATASDTLKSLCERKPDVNEANLNSTLTTDNRTGVTYSNLYCAVCWNVSTHSLVTWRWNLECTGQWTSRSRKSSQANVTQLESLINGAHEISLAITYLRTKCSLDYTPPPSIVNKMYLCWQDLVDRCPLGTPEHAAAACSHGAAATAFFDGLPYRNADCVRCWSDVNDSLADVSCEAPADDSEKGVLAKPDVFRPASQSFSVLLSPESDECPLASTPLDGLLDAAAAMIGSSALKQRQLCDLLVRCLFISVGRESQETEQHIDPQCSLFCPGGEFVRGTGCRIRNSSRTCHYATNVEDAARFTSASGAKFSLNASFVDDTLIVPVDDTVAVCFACASVREYTNYKRLANGTLIAWDGDDTTGNDDWAVHTQPMYIVNGNVARACILREPADVIERWTSGGGGAGGCVQLPEVVSTALLVISEASLVVFAALYATVPALRRFPGYMVVSEAIAFFVGFLLFLLRPAAAATHSFALCAVTAAGAHYFLSAAFVWMALYASQIVRAMSLRPRGSGSASAASLSSRCRCCTYGTSDAPRCMSRAANYRLIGWGFPLALVAAGLSADALDTDWRPAYGPPHCFIRSRLGNRILFVGPLCACVSLGVAIYAYMIVKLASVVRQTAIARLHGTVGGIASAEKLALAAKLALSLGLLWTFAGLAAFVDNAELECAFVALNSLQGAFLLAAHGSGREVRRRHWYARCWSHCAPSRPTRSLGDSRGSGDSDGKRFSSITASTKTSSFA